MTNGNDLINSVVQTSTSPYGGERMECTDGGLTKREYFAAMAMQGIVADPNGYIMAADIAKGAVEIADALINELNK